MSRAFISILNAHSIGDTINQMFIDILVERTFDDQYWLLHTADNNNISKDLVNGWIHFDLLALYKRAGLYKRLIYINGISNANYASGHANGRWQYREHAKNYISKVYSKEYDEIYLGIPIEIGPTIYMPEELKSRFSFLKEDAKPYSTVQCLSTHYNTGKILPNNLIDSFASDKKCVKFLGSLQETQRVQSQIDRLKETFPDVELINCCGGSVEDYFKIIYNSESNLSTESSSSLLASQLGIPSIIQFVYRREMEAWIEKFKNVPTLTFV